MVYTSKYDNVYSFCYKEKLLSISGDRGKDAYYTGECYPALAPKREFWNVWKSNIGRIPEEENTKYYIREFYDQVLSKLNVDEEYQKLNEKILLCYEEPNDFCHRQIVASWFELFMGVKVPEIRQVGDKMEEIYIDRSFIKDYLEEYIKTKIDTRGFNSLYALHIYEKAERLEKVAKNNSDVDLAFNLRNAAYDIEDEYLDEKEMKMKK